MMKNLAKKAAGITAAALLFGTVSGGVMAGLNAWSSSVLEVKESRAVPQKTAAVSAQNTDTGGMGGTIQTIGVTDVSGIVEQAMPSVVAITDKMTVEQMTFFGPQSYEAESSGSGIIIGENDKELLIATNNHVVDGAQNMTVTFVDETSVEAAIKGTDAASDLAVIAVPLDKIPSDTMSRIKAANIGDSDSLKVGQQVVAIGNALGEGQSATVGYVSALDRKVKGEDGTEHTFIQTDAAINPGNSGGALLDLGGNLIGINAAKTASTEVEGMGYAIPISKAMEILDPLMTKQTRVKVDDEKRGWLGIEGTNIDAQASQAYDMPVGIFVYKILDDGAAAGSDLREKDIITKFDGQSVTTLGQLQNMLTYYEKGSKVTLTVQSLADGKYQEREVEITLGGQQNSN
ncbi:trypsin-like peptidase domain-containing protein [Clostridium sp. MCC353]|uniref:S1C family serine protease n=1 Tax=Clostridium sp. MCC353 TaxID=2592646 RepID=UPI00207A156D|nr:trypsin-like peptidase domain-containing protein [Clostridium sp. MCC353]